MTHLTALELLHGVFWGAGGVAPLILASMWGRVCIEPEKEMPPGAFLIFWGSLISQIGILVIAYKAGGK